MARKKRRSDKRKKRRFSQEPLPSPEKLEEAPRSIIPFTGAGTSLATAEFRPHSEVFFGYGRAERKFTPALFDAVSRVYSPTMLDADMLDYGMLDAGIQSGKFLAAARRFSIPAAQAKLTETEVRQIQRAFRELLTGLDVAIGRQAKAVAAMEEELSKWSI